MDGEHATIAPEITIDAPPPQRKLIRPRAGCYCSEPWTDEREAILTEMWKSGKSAGMIANRLGGTTRNAIIGKVYRMGLPRRKTTDYTPRRSRKYLTATHRKAAQVTGPTGLFARTAMALAQLRTLPLPKRDPNDVGTKSIIELEHDECRYIPGDDHLCCGAKKEHAALPYCSKHAAICYQTIAQEPIANKLTRGHQERVFEPA